ncbi:YesL family protein [[Clostridium] fimetarium]|uniref:Uncharacterized membrane protein YesL n=1 Tax=[Clostridium] fimetarium TaxID=99656 RepID=A0A1I0NMP1_9FIRM|nr:DUF624 domain-containing protein [[Clostridium] fimetarium]SEW02736.1 Uncharacterized membrane protein YesL [[Clostridium] fimetarium]
MAQKLFDIDSPILRFMNKLFDMVLLTVIWAICCLPIFTIGAATTALYYVTMKMASDIEGYIFKDFFKAFRSNFKQATGIWMIMLAFGLTLIGSAWWYYKINNSLSAVALPVLLIVAGLYIIVLIYIFPLLARCEVTVKQLIKMAFVMSLKNFKWTLFMIVCSACMLAMGIFVAAPLLLIGVGLIAYIHAKVLQIVFEPYHLNLK